MRIKDGRAALAALLTAGALVALTAPPVQAQRRASIAGMQGCAGGGTGTAAMAAQRVATLAAFQQCNAGLAALQQCNAGLVALQTSGLTGFGALQQDCMASLVQQLQQQNALLLAALRQLQQQNAALIAALQQQSTQVNGFQASTGR
jgi:hypothetical protein